MKIDIQTEFKIRNSKSEDHIRIIEVMEDWWEGRDLTWMVPKLFLIHFNNTSFIIKKNNNLVAFLIAFLSPANEKEGYIHIVGVHPDYRGLRIGEYLYNQFFQICRDHNRNTVRSCTSPINKGSIEFHRRIGFKIRKGNAVIDGVDVTLDYNKPGDTKVLFEINI